MRINNLPASGLNSHAVTSLVGRMFCNVRGVVAPIGDQQIRLAEEQLGCGYSQWGTVADLVAPVLTLKS